MSDPGSLQNLQDIVEPAIIGYWPPAPGAWLFPALVVLWIGVGAAALWLRRRRNAYRRAGLQELSIVRRKLIGKKAPTAVQELAALLKRVALTAFPRQQVASLSGDKWLAFLDATLDEKIFTGSSGHLLTEAPYRPAMYGALSEEQIENLCHLAEIWIKKHRLTLPAAQNN